MGHKRYKVKAELVRLGVRADVGPLILKFGNYMEVNVQLHAPRPFNLLATDFFLILAHPVFKM